MPHRPRRTTFMLTPLIDVIFLLLIFFMLSSQIAPYSLMPFGIVAEGGGEARPAGAGFGSGPAPLTVRVSRGSVSVGGETIALSDLARAAAQLADRGVRSFVLIPAAAARVEDIVSALEALREARAAEVTLLHSRRPGR